MDSINALKGYGKVNPEHHLEVQAQKIPQPPKRPIITALVISAIVGLTFVIGLMLAALIHESTTEPKDESPSLSSSAESTIKIVCNVTRYPESCFTSISSLNSSPKPDPESILKLSLQVSISELSHLSSVLKTMNSDAAIRDCRDQVEDALSQLDDSVSAMVVGKALTEAKVKDVQTWISSAVTDQETCLDGLEEMGSASVDEVKKKIKKSMDFTSNSLAIVANFKAILDRFSHSPLH
ncbi:putative pectinesterase [Rosa chinensis]|uniref:pectinesterase n=1 Tax=Rosa chinensis TaxID=74649 RepID=A0A2P6P2I8_ROSCH|nr:pectinesterase 3 [Rosa chinensis]PRQ16138.1 putative pectinesterase [Rosa chinensis]